jgi:hypothetical protein
MMNINKGTLNQKALEAVKVGQEIKFLYKHPVLDGEEATFTFKRKVTEYTEEMYMQVERLGESMLVEYIEDGIMKVYIYDMMGQRTTYQFDLSKIEVLGYTFKDSEI